MVTPAPEVQKREDASIDDSAPPMMKDVSPPCLKVKVSVSKVRGALAETVPPGPPRDQSAGPPEVMLQGAAHEGGLVEPVSVPAKTTWQVEGVQAMLLPPLFLIEMEMATGDDPDVPPALREAERTTTLAVEVAPLTRL